MDGFTRLKNVIRKIHRARIDGLDTFERYLLALQAGSNVLSETHHPSEIELMRGGTSQNGHEHK